MRSQRADLPRVTVVGLGPGDASYVTEHTRSEIARVPVRFVRTRRHPSASLVPDAVSFDDVYERADRFEDVYAEIVERLAAAAHEHGEVLYAVPGSPLVLERSVRVLLTHPGVTCRVHPAMSFLDLVWARLGVDPVDDGVTLVDGHRFAVDAAGRAGPLLVAHAHADWVLSDIKLAVDGATGDEEVVILQRLGTPDEHIVRTTWSELDRTVAADHLTSVYIRRLAAPVAAETTRMHELVRTLRERCPWDREQTHTSLVRYLVEEAYELVDALQAHDPDDPASDDHLVEELGDVLFQIEFHAVIAEQDGRFSMADVARTVHDKLVRRHPHVFGDVVADDAATVASNWAAIKHAEKQRTSVLDGIAEAQPSLAYADALQRRAARAGFDWPDVHGALPKVAEEAAEVVAAMGESPSRVADEVGDLLFAVVNVARHLSVEPETALRAAAQRFRRRFADVEGRARDRGIDLSGASLDVLDALWDEAKAAER